MRSHASATKGHRDLDFAFPAWHRASMTIFVVRIRPRSSDPRSGPPRATLDLNFRIPRIKHCNFGQVTPNIEQGVELSECTCRRFVRTLVNIAQFDVGSPRIVRGLHVPIDVVAWWQQMAEQDLASRTPHCAMPFKAAQPGRCRNCGGRHVALVAFRDKSHSSDCTGRALPAPGHLRSNSPGARTLVELFGMGPNTGRLWWTCWEDVPKYGATSAKPGQTREGIQRTWAEFDRGWVRVHQILGQNSARETTEFNLMSVNSAKLRTESTNISSESINMGS